MRKKLITILMMLSLIICCLSGCGTENAKSNEGTQDTGISTAGDNKQDTKVTQPKHPKLSEPLSNTNFFMSTVVTISLYDYGDDDVIQGCFDICDKYEHLLSRTLETSEIYRLNHADPSEFPFEVSDDTAELLSKALYYAELSGGAFDPSIAPLAELWNIMAENPRKPSDAAIQALLPHISYKDIVLEGNKVTLTDPHAAIDLGAIAKGYIADRIKDYLLSEGVNSAVINLGGNVLLVGSKPDGSVFKIGVQKPFEHYSETIAVAGVKDLSIVSSGIYERFFREDGVLYHHILNPFTGYPYVNDLTSVTIISPLSVDGDGLSTTCFALGLEKGLELINSMDGVYAMFITEDNELHYSEGFEDFIIPQ